MRKLIENFLAERDLAHISTGDGTWAIPVEGDSGTWTMQLTIVPEYDQILVYGDIDVAVPVARRLALAEWAARANRGLPVGNFEVDIDTGATWFKSSIDVEGDELSAALLENLLAVNFASVDRYRGNFIRFVGGELEAFEAVAAAEGFPITELDHDDDADGDTSGSST